MEQPAKTTSPRETSQPAKPAADATDLSLFVRTSDLEMREWDRQKIVDALILETGINPEIAKIIGLEVEKQLMSSPTRIITAPLVRELVDVKLIEYGLEDIRKKHTRLGSPLYDVRQIILNRNKENANVPFNPEATNLTLAENIKKEFALLEVFPQDIADAHIQGEIHLHDLGFIDRPYCSGQSLEYVKKFGLDLPNALSIAKPAKHPEVLLAQMLKFSAALQGHFAGAIGWDAVNLFFAPFLEDKTDKEIEQVAQMLIYEFSQQAVARGGQAIFSDINLYWEIPKHFEDVPAIGPGGAYTGKTYKEYLATSQKFLWKLFDVYMDGDGSGRPFFFPKPLCHITEKFFRTPGHEEFLEHICRVAAEKGNTYFVFDRGETAKISECCRLSFKLERSDINDALEPWKMRYSALQNVTINLPRLGYLAAGDRDKLWERMEQAVDVMARAHVHKKMFIEKLLSAGSGGPLSLLAMARDGESYLRMHRVTYLVGLLGLNELVQTMTGKQIHQSQEALRFGLLALAQLNLMVRKASEKYKMRFVLEQSPAESASYRLAKLDMKYFPEEAGRVIKGNKQTGEIYYTNSTQMNISEPINPIDRIRLEGMFHPLIEAGAISHIWLGESKPSAESLASLVIKTFRQTESAQIDFSPEFTTCNECNKVSRGLLNKCPYCGSQIIEGVTRLSEQASTQRWNKGRLGEFKDRFRYELAEVSK